MDDLLKGLDEDEWFSADDKVDFWIAGTEGKSVGDKRADVRNPVALHVRVEPGGRPAMAEDLSLGGILIHTDVPMMQGREIGVKIESSRGTVETRGVVRWLAKGASSYAAGTKLCMGVQFTWMDIGMREIFTP